MRAACLRLPSRSLVWRWRPLATPRPAAQCCALMEEATQHARTTALQASIPLHSTPIRPASLPPLQQADQEDGSGWDVPPPHQWGQDQLLMSGCEPDSKLQVAVLLSGGVDSSLALRLLLAAGHQCTAFYLQIWFQEDFRNFWDACPWEEDLGYARQVCEALGVELRVVPMTTHYWDRVVSHSVNEIREGRTPNPDMLCNSCVKFGAFYDYLEKEHPGCFDRIASGHYARVVRGPATQSVSFTNALDQHDVSGIARSTKSVDGSGSPAVASNSAARQIAASCKHGAVHSDHDSATNNGSSSLATEAWHRAGWSASGEAAEPGPGSIQASAGLKLARLALTPDAVKDQTYFLAHLSPSQLSRAMFPLGALTKRQVRQLANVAQLANMDRKDSQGICFLGKVKFHEFVKEHLGEWPGLLVESETGRVVGLHLGYWFYTVGQRSGIKLPGGPWYVLQKDRQLNVVYVSREYYTDDKSRNTFVTGPINWVSHVRPDLRHPLYCKVRHGPSLYECRSFELLPAAELAGWHEQQGSEPAVSTRPPTSLVPAGPGQAETHELGARVVLHCNDQGLAAGQYAVFYQHGTCLGAAKLL